MLHDQFTIIAKTLQGLETVLADEVKSLGASHIDIGKRVVSFKADKKLMYRANLELRTALRLLLPIASFEVRDEKSLYDGVRKIEWETYLQLSQTFAIDAVTHSEIITHSQYAALKTKDAIADRFRHLNGARPSVNVHHPDVRIHLHISNNMCNLSLDSSGRSLNQRGYRLDGGFAPLNEVLAAGMVLLSGWKGDTHFIDPMCGSGTLPIEAALYAYNIPPQINRSNFGFLKWQNMDRDLWENVQEEAASKHRSPGILIQGSDENFRAVKTARANVLSAYLEDKVSIDRKKIAFAAPPPPPGILITNPPYDERMEIEDVAGFYKDVGDILKQKYSGYHAWIISGSQEGLKHVGLRAYKKIALLNGKLPCKFQGYELYDGSLKNKKE